MADGRKIASRVALAVMIVAIVAIAAICATLIYMQSKGGDLKPSPKSEEQVVEEDGFPEVDWEYWQETNPDIIGWITVPGTIIDYPIAQAPADDPEYYLYHDAYKDWNYVGCPYLDAGCAEKGIFGSSNSVVFGHNMGWSQETFGDLKFYVDPEYAESHADVLIQTPFEKRKYAIQAVDIIPSWDAVKRTQFEDTTDAMKWWKARYDAADVKVNKEIVYSKNMVTLCTCSNNYWSNERTLVYCL